MDALSDALRIEELSGTLYLSVEFTPPWPLISQADREVGAFFLPDSCRGDSAKKPTYWAATWDPECECLAVILFRASPCKACQILASHVKRPAICPRRKRTHSLKQISSGLRKSIACAVFKVDDTRMPELLQTRTEDVRRRDITALLKHAKRLPLSITQIPQNPKRPASTEQVQDHHDGLSRARAPHRFSRFDQFFVWHGLLDLSISLGYLLDSAIFLIAFRQHTPRRVMMKISIDQAQQALDSQPFSRMLGAALEHIDAESVVIVLPLRHDLKQQHGFAHGGVLSYLADNALTFAGALGLGRAVLTSEFKINYVRPAVGDVLVARANVIYAGQRQAVCRCDVFVRVSSGEKLVATAQGTISKVENPERPQ
jgi:uncharacterized protein (TIGR00369 family)